MSHRLFVAIAGNLHPGFIHIVVGAVFRLRNCVSDRTRSKDPSEKLIAIVQSPIGPLDLGYVGKCCDESAARHRFAEEL